MRSFYSMSALNQGDGEYKYRHYHRGFCYTIITGGSIHYNTVARIQSTYKNKRLSSPPPFINVMYCVRVSQKTVKYSLHNTQEKEVTHG